MKNAKTRLEGFQESYKADPVTGCWVWQKQITSHGYGGFWYGMENGKKNQGYGHRFAYEHFRGPVPDGLELDHLCRNRRCVNPYHLEAVTHKVNSDRGLAPVVNTVRGKAVRRCKNGHDFTSENTYVWTAHVRGKVRTWRGCIMCRRANGQRSRMKSRRTNAQMSLGLR